MGCGIVFMEDWHGDDAQFAATIPQEAEQNSYSGEPRWKFRRPVNRIDKPVGVVRHATQFLPQASSNRERLQ